MARTPPRLPILLLLLLPLPRLPELIGLTPHSPSLSSGRRPKVHLLLPPLYNPSRSSHGRQLESEPRFLNHREGFRVADCCRRRRRGDREGARAWSKKLAEGSQPASQVKGLTSFRPSGDQAIFRAALACKAPASFGRVSHLRSCHLFTLWSALYCTEKEGRKEGRRGNSCFERRSISGGFGAAAFGLYIILHFIFSHTAAFGGNRCGGREGGKGREEDPVRHDFALITRTGSL